LKRTRELRETTPRKALSTAGSMTFLSTRLGRTRGVTIVSVEAGFPPVRSIGE